MYTHIPPNQSNLTIGILAKNGVVIAAEKKTVDKLLVKPKVSEKLVIIDDHVAVGIAGLASDANVLVSYLRQTAQVHRKTYQEPIPIHTLIEKVCNLKQGYTQFGGRRPFGVGFLFAGYDEEKGFQLYRSDPSGNYGGWFATAIGANNRAATAILKTDYQEECSVDEALQLAVKVLVKTMDVSKPDQDNMEFSVIKFDEATGALVVQGNTDVSDILAQLEAEEAAEADA